MTRLLAVSVALAIVVNAAFAQHLGAPTAGGGGSRNYGASRPARVTRAPHGNGFRRGVRQRYGGGPNARHYEAPAGSAATRFDVGSAPERPEMPGSRWQDGDRDRDDRGRGLDGRYGRRWESGRERGIPYVNPYGYGYPLSFSGLSYAGDLGYGDAGAGDAGSNDEDAVEGGSGADADTDGDNQDSDSPPERDTEDAEPAGAQRSSYYSAFSGGSATGGAAYMQPPDSLPTEAITGQGIHRSVQGGHTRANRKANSAQRDSTTVTLVFKDGRPSQTIHNYALTRSTLYVMDAEQQEIPVADLDMPATEKANREAGVKFQLPK